VLDLIFKAQPTIVSRFGFVGKPACATRTKGESGVEGEVEVDVKRGRGRGAGVNEEGRVIVLSD
jgi:hypothetical protein